MTQFLSAGEGSTLTFKHTAPTPPAPPLYRTIPAPGLEYIKAVGRWM